MCVYWSSTETTMKLKSTLQVRALDEVVMVGCPDSSEVPLPTTGATAQCSKMLQKHRDFIGIS